MVLKTKELEEYLVVARCTEAWLRMHRVPRILPMAKMRRNSALPMRARSPLARLRGSGASAVAAMVLRVEAWNFGHLTLGLFDNAMVYRQQINLFSRS